MSASSGYGTGGSTPVGPVIETLTGNVGGPVGPTANNIDIIGAGGVLVTGNPGTSTLTITVSGIATQYDEDVGSAFPALGILNILGGASTAGINMNTFGDGGNTVTVILNDSLFFPNTNAAGTQGVLFWGGDTFLHNFGLGNTWAGALAGNLTSIGIFNVGVGTNALNSNTGVSSTVAVGYNAMAANSTGVDSISIGKDSFLNATAIDNSIAIGSNALANITDSEDNIAIGYFAGTNYTGVEQSNVLLNHVGVLGDNNTMRLGTDGVADGQQDATYIAGIYNRAFASPSGVMQIDSTFKVGSSAGTDGQLLIGSTGASPLWANLTSAGGTVTITNLPNAINLEASGTPGGASTFPTDFGVALEALGVLNIFGGISTAGFNIHTTGAGNTVTVVLEDTLFFPNTNLAGDQGVLNWGGNRFIHNRGIDNTFIGSNAGNFTLTTVSAIDNAVLGAATLSALTTGASNSVIGSNALSALTTGTGNTAAGFAVLDNLVSGDANIALGLLAGTNYTSSESNNILLNNFGVVGESNTIRIGRSGVHTDCYVQGIYNASIGTTNAPVFIDNTGKLGTLEAGTPLDGSSFMAVVSPSESISNTVGVNLLGVNTAMTVLYDNFSGAFFPGDGAGSEAAFTAPIDGFYQFTAGFVLNTTSSGSELSGTLVLNGTDYLQMSSSIFTGSGGMRKLAVTVSGYIQLAVSDVVTFSATINASFPNPPLFLGNQFGGDPYKTFVSGVLLRTS